MERNVLKIRWGNLLVKLSGYSRTGMWRGTRSKTGCKECLLCPPRNQPNYNCHTQKNSEPNSSLLLFALLESKREKTFGASNNVLQHSIQGRAEGVVNPCVAVTFQDEVLTFSVFSVLKKIAGIQFLTNPSNDWLIKWILVKKIIVVRQFSPNLSGKLWYVNHIVHPSLNLRTPLVSARAHCLELHILNTWIHPMGLTWYLYGPSALLNLILSSY